ncbi:MAG: serine O-acetyltransferase [Candidatus Omnitrophota bacterium]
MGILLLILVILVVGFFAVATLFRGEIQAAFDRDPAATNFFEVVLTYAGLHALIFHRISHRLYLWKTPFFPRLISQLGRSFTGIEIHPGATIGKRCFIDHGMGVVIGETSIVGDNVTLFQGVTLGGTGKERGKRHPTLGNNVVVGTGAKILGNITLGDHAQIGANAVVIKDVPPYSTVVGVPGRIVRMKGQHLPDINLDHTNLPDPITQALSRLQNEISAIEHQLKEWHQAPKESGPK